MAAPATVSINHGEASSSGLRTYVVLLEGSSADGSGVVVAQSSGRLDDWLLAAGTYTIEVTTSSALATGNYAVRAHWAPADACVVDLGALGAETVWVSGGGVVAVDESCVSSQRAPG